MNQYYGQKVTGAEPLGGYRLRVIFSDGFSAEIDLTPLLDCGPIFEPLRDPGFFARVGVDAAFGCLLWPGDLDLSSGSLRAWCEAGKVMNHDETDAWIERHAIAPERVA